MLNQWKFCLMVLAIGMSPFSEIQADEQSVRLADMDVVVWSKAVEEGAKQPVIIFSHGFHGSATQSRFLMEAFSSAGYLVFAPNHHDAVRQGGKVTWLDEPKVSFLQVETWNDKSYDDRADDIRRLIKAIPKDERFRKHADLSRIGLIGHSLGGYTVLGLGGAWPSWRLPDVKAVLALSPFVLPFTLNKTLGDLSAPVMYQGGTLDFTITPSLRHSKGAYDQSPKPKYYVEFDTATHLAWTDIGRIAHEQIITYSVLFMNHFVKGDPADARLAQQLSGVAQFRHDSK